MSVSHARRHHHGVRYYDMQPVLASLETATTLATIVTSVKPFCDAYGYALVCKTTDGASPTVSSFTYTAVSDADVVQIKGLVRQMVEEFSRYPSTFFTPLDLTTMWITKRMTLSGVDGAVAVTISSDHGIYYSLFTDVTQNVGWGSGQDAYRNVLNHELSHIIDNTYGADNQSMRSAWEASNPAGWQYNQTTQPGFMTAYASTNYYEDRAETNAWNMTPHLYWRLQQRAIQDTTLATKSTMLMGQVTGKTPDWQHDANRSASGDYT